MNRFEAKKLRLQFQVEKYRLPLNVIQQDRSCGECQACCEVIGVHEIEKPVWTKCINQCEAGCGIYADRPSSCRTYYCMWQAGMLRDENARPDKIGVIFDFREKINVWELWPGAANENMELIAEIAKRFPVKVNIYHEIRTIQPGRS